MAACNSFGSEDSDKFPNHSCETKGHHQTTHSSKQNLVNFGGNGWRYVWYGFQNPLGTKALRVLMFSYVREHVYTSRPRGQLNMQLYSQARF